MQRQIAQVYTMCPASFARFETKIIVGDSKIEIMQQCHVTALKRRYINFASVHIIYASTATFQNVICKHKRVALEV